uniref:Uncharacterized protein n=1 Tax=Timema genevievae TaxID=629358 RepID=A0A7R9JWU5_TIMGE|nr:unnamed protein product [Timema genevievae]
MYLSQLVSQTRHDSGLVGVKPALVLITLMWLKDLFWIGTKKDLEYSDLYNTLPSQLSDKLGDDLERNWNKERESARNTQRAPSLLRVLWKTFAWSYMWCGVSTLVLTCGLRIMTPILLGSLIAYFNPESTYTKSDAYMYAAALITCSLATALCSHNTSFGNQVVGMNIRVACCSLVYRKTLRLSRTALGQTEAGKMVNLLSNDVNRFEQLTYFLHYLWVLPIQTIIIISVIWQWVGVSAAIGVGTIFMQTIPSVSTASLCSTNGTRRFCSRSYHISNAIKRSLDLTIVNLEKLLSHLHLATVVIPRSVKGPTDYCWGCLAPTAPPLRTPMPLTQYKWAHRLSMFISKLTSKLRMKIATRTDERVRLMSEIISGIQVIKMYAWEKPFEKMVALARRTEINVIRKASYLRGLNLSFMVFAERTTLFVTLASFVLMGNHITAEKVFSIAQYCNILNMTMAVASPIAMQMIAETKVSIKRLERFLLQEEFQVAPLTQGPQVEKLGVTLDSATARWLPSSISDTLHKVALQVKPGQLCAIIGPVGSGKSSLLQVLLGELPLSSGSMSLRGEVSYASQEPWMFVGTVRQNILFGQPYQPKRYKEVVRACALTRDLELFPNGDKTLVGERGVSLSGGQRARINLARAVYRDADIYLLDDPLSAVDTHVGRHLFEECVDTYLTKKIRILVTHQLQYLKEVDLIVILNNGQIEAQGTFQQLQESKFNFAQLLTSSEGDTDEAVPPTMRQLSSQISNQALVLLELSVELTRHENNTHGSWTHVMNLRTALGFGPTGTPVTYTHHAMSWRLILFRPLDGRVVAVQLLRVFFVSPIRIPSTSPLGTSVAGSPILVLPTLQSRTRRVYSSLEGCSSQKKQRDECECRDVSGTELLTSGGDNEHISHMSFLKKVTETTVGQESGETNESGEGSASHVEEGTENATSAEIDNNRGEKNTKEGSTEISDQGRKNTKLKRKQNESLEEQEETEEPTETQELLTKGSLKSTVYMNYFKSGGGIYTLLFLVVVLVLGQVATSGADYWVTFWCVYMGRPLGHLLVCIYGQTIGSPSGVYTLVDHWVTFWSVYMGRLLDTNPEQIMTNQEELRKYYFDLELEKSVFELHGNSTEQSLEEVSNISDVGPHLTRNLTQDVIFSTETCILGSVIITILRSVVFFKVCMTASRRLHDTMFSSILQGTMRFFDTNPSAASVFLILLCIFRNISLSACRLPVSGNYAGYESIPVQSPGGIVAVRPSPQDLDSRVLNRFSKDMGSADEMLPKTLIEATQTYLRRGREGWQEGRQLLRGYFEALYTLSCRVTVTYENILHLESLFSTETILKV